MPPKTPIEIKMLNSFYDDYFSLRAYTQKVKPSGDDIAAFVLEYKWGNVERNKNLLAFFMFEFWRLGYMIKKPSKTRLLLFLKKFNDN